MNRLLASMACLTLASLAHGADPKPTCSAAAVHQFDFWIGSWRVTEHGKTAGHNRIEAIVGGCALLENWEGASGGSGKSLNFFDAADGLWHQTWIDRTGGALFLAGKFEDGHMRLEGERPAKGTQSAMRHRITWTALADGKVRQLWESAPVGKEQWTVQFDGLYERDSAAH